MIAGLSEGGESASRLLRWKKEAKQCAPVNLASGIDLTMPLEEMHVAMPPLSPFHVLHSSDILTELVHIPSITVTAMTSAAFGALVTLLLTFRNDVLVVKLKKLLRGSAFRVRRLIAICVASVMLLRFLRGRYPTVLRVSQYEDLSKNPDRPCFVTSHLLSMTNSHAGTHADGPHHFCRSVLHRNFDDAHYTGDAIVLDITSELLDYQQTASTDFVPIITERVLKIARAKLPELLRNGSRPIWRLLLVTRHSRELNSADTHMTENSRQVAIELSPSDPVSATEMTAVGVNGSLAARSSSLLKSFAFLSPSAVQYLRAAFPNLLLVGIDSPSVDPLWENNNHVSFLQEGIAVLENLSYRRLFPFLEIPSGARQRGWVSGSMLTVFNVTQNYDDARGCSVIFFPEEEV